MDVLIKALDTIDVVTGASLDHCAVMSDRVMFPAALERLIALEAIGVIDRARTSVREIVAHELFRGDGVDRFDTGPFITATFDLVTRSAVDLEGVAQNVLLIAQKDRCTTEDVFSPKPPSELTLLRSLRTTPITK